ncbi:MULTISPECIES: LysR family transcriptional regulator [Pseudomonas]|jgi:DNA-binding transcriptional LysR family regulator|uniref:LysR family transcriptional regulator n=1 Tax=Pseudomonas frederiksbergensis TaxID=104087 RepID=A0A0B1Z2J2_9PSED|nr:MULTISPECIES: LysR substrate-binding domain-containing protein [Pseudomonas]KHK63518.1 LysR family transcriptional regulator [Pseudomonas frederiksbergensis]MBI6621369.1 LysR family transcriptional regulator [Pseudomonas corrugata]MBI6694733.1 LysR family transcriptional regulator [Pseudomonas corrugata]WRV68910.1 LysR substrate-binding domain-containing protein [Pseudomonas frederiksbergensis]
MELSQLRMLKAVCDTGSVARAAETLHCVPSNITARLKSLERELGTSLFFREGRGLRISPAGQIFLEYATRILSLAEEARRAIAPSNAPSGPLRIGAIESSATGRLPQLLARYHAQFPQVSLELSTGTWAQLLDDISHHRLDGAIVAVDVERPGLKRAVMYREDLVLIAADSLGPLRSAADLQGLAIFMWPVGCPYRLALEQWLLRQGQAQPITSIASYGAIVGCVSAGAGVSLVPRGIYERYRQGAGWTGYEFPELAGVDNLFYWNENAGRHPAREAFLAMLEREFEGGDN